MTEFFYRYEDILVGDEYSSSTHLILWNFPVLQHTPKGVWLGVYGKKRFVLLGTRKKFAAATKSEALESFIARKDSQLGIYKARARRAAEALRMSKAMAAAVENGTDYDAVLANAGRGPALSYIDFDFDDGIEISL